MTRQRQRQLEDTIHRRRTGGDGSGAGQKAAAAAAEAVAEAAQFRGARGARGSRLPSPAPRLPRNPAPPAPALQALLDKCTRARVVAARPSCASSVERVRRYHHCEDPCSVQPESYRYHTVTRSFSFTSFRLFDADADVNGRCFVLRRLTSCLKSVSEARNYGLNYVFFILRGRVHPFP